MTKAQTAWAGLTALFLAAAVVLLTVESGSTGRIMGWLCWGSATLGWLLLAGMIANDTRTANG